MGKVVAIRKWVILGRGKMGKTIIIWPLQKGTWKV